jgi:hypothetical protein
MNEENPSRFPIDPIDFGKVHCRFCSKEAEWVLWSASLEMPVNFCDECYWEYFRMLYGTEHKHRGFIFDQNLALY